MLAALLRPLPAIVRQFPRVGGGMKRILIVFGTRPEAIKMAPLALAAKRDLRFEATVCVTGQHRQMLDETMEVFGLSADIDLDIMTPGQTLADVTQRTLVGIDGVLKSREFDWVIVQGDTTSAFAASLAAFYNKVSVAHVEAGLRTGDRLRPWPEEVNRRLVGVVTDRHYAPTALSRDNLLKENTDPASVLVTGNTVIDALLIARDKIASDPSLLAQYAERFPFLASGRRVVLVTGHRRESFGDGFRNICQALRKIAERGDVEVVYPVHLNPNVQQPVYEILSDVPKVHLIAPQPYLPFVHLMNHCHLVLTDSGGIQEEAPSLAKPVVVMRTTSERMEAVHAGAAVLVGADADRIVSQVSALLDDSALYARMASVRNPFGDGTAARLILEDLAR